MSKFTTNEPEYRIMVQREVYKALIVITGLRQGDDHSLIPFY